MSSHWIVVGAGSAGCVVANRLTADPSRHVTLIEAGPDLLPGSMPPGIAGRNFYEALSEAGRSYSDLTAARTKGGQRTPYQRGRGVAGSSAVNAMVALSGSKHRYRRWGWTDIDEAVASVALTFEQASLDEVGPVDRALLAADSRTELAMLTRASARRVTSAESYLWPIRERDNLTVQAETEVEAVTFAGTKATGVQLADATTLAADRVVLAAGAIHSPAILLRSGVEVDGLGRGLQDHPSATFVLKLRPEIAHDQSGLVCGSVLHAQRGENLIQVLPLSSVGVTPETAGLGAILTALMTPVGNAGQVDIDDDGQPVVDFALLDDERDLAALVDGVQLAIEVLRSDPFHALASDVFIDDQGTPLDALKTPEDIAFWLRASCGDYVHASSSCAMGTVVDNGGAVRGYDDLFVCDASIFPSIPDANTHLPTTMLAERMCMPGRLIR